MDLGDDGGGGGVLLIKLFIICRLRRKLVNELLWRNIIFIFQMFGNEAILNNQIDLFLMIYKNLLFIIELNEVNCNAVREQV